MFTAQQCVLSPLDHGQPSTKHAAISCEPSLMYKRRRLTLSCATTTLRVMMHRSQLCTKANYQAALTSLGHSAYLYQFKCTYRAFEQSGLWSFRNLRKFRVGVWKHPTNVMANQPVFFSSGQAYWMLGIGISSC